MTLHECLYFLNEMTLAKRQFNGDTVGEPWSYPLRVEVVMNLRRNRDHFPTDLDIRDSFKRVYRLAKRRGLVAEGPCSDHCHSAHMFLTDAGLKELLQLNRHGCTSPARPVGPCQCISKLKFKFEEAA